VRNHVHQLLIITAVITSSSVIRQFCGVGSYSLERGHVAAVEYNTEKEKIVD